MTFDEWFHKEYEPADLQIKQCAERNEGLHIPATVYLEDLKKAFEAGLHADVHTDNSKVIADLEEKLANADYQLEGRDLEIKELKAQLGNLYEIIKRPYQFTAPKKIQMVEKAEQFLKEVEK